MTTTPTSTIALVTCDVSSKINFAHVVGEMRRSLDRSPLNTYTLAWDHDDIATFDFESTRIVLSLECQSLRINEADADRLFISVGPPSVGHLRREPEVAYEQLSSMIVERVCGYYVTKPVYWQQIEGCVTSDTVDQIFDEIALAHSRSQIVNIAAAAFVETPEQRTPTNIVQLSVLPTRVPRPRSKGDTRQKPSQAHHAARDAQVEVANDIPVGLRYDSDRLRAIRTALYEVQDGPSSEETGRSTPIARLSATALDATLVIVCLPVGAAMLTYHVFRGGEIRHTAHMMTITGLFLASSKVFSTMPLTSFL